MSNEVIVKEESGFFTPENVDLLRDTICKGATPDEFKLFMHACERTGLDPFMKQIYAVKRWDNTLGRLAMTVQTGIDGYRLIAERTKKYSPGREPSYTYDKNGRLESATAYVKKMTHDGTWHEVSASAYYSEYVQTKKDGSPVSMWAQMPRNQLAKCAESLALRKCFPAEMSGLYTKEEMDQSEVIDVESEIVKESAPKTEQKKLAPILKEKEEKIVTPEMVKFLTDFLDRDSKYKDEIEGFVVETFNVTKFEDLKYIDFVKVYKDVQKRFKSIEELQNVGRGNEGVNPEVQG